MIRLKIKKPELVFQKAKTAEEALEQSIKKWNWIADVIEEVDSMLDDDHCPLCNFFDGSQPHCTHEHRGDDALCQNCPIDEYTNGCACDGTPYVSVLDRMTDVENKICDEIEFLEELRDNL